MPSPLVGSADPGSQGIGSGLATTALARGVQSAAESATAQAVEAANLVGTTTEVSAFNNRPQYPSPGPFTVREPKPSVPAGVGCEIRIKIEILPDPYGSRGNYAAYTNPKQLYDLYFESNARELANGYDRATELVDKALKDFAKTNGFEVIDQEERVHDG